MKKPVNSLSFKKIAILIFILFVSINVSGAFLRNVPVKIKQPDGTEINCFTTGDEFYHWLHDINNYTLIKNTATGYLFYALIDNGKLAPSNYVAGTVNPASVGLNPGNNIYPEKSNFKSALADDIHPAPRIGDFNNIVVFVRFADQPEYSSTIANYDEIFNGNDFSMKGYFNEISGNQLNVLSTFYPAPDNNYVVSYQDIHERNYYIMYDPISNPIGYKEDERTDREHTLLQNAIESVKTQIEGQNLIFDSDNDGYLDNICFIVQGNAEGWSDLLWPHKWSLYSKEVYIDGNRVSSYNFQLSDWTNVSVLCHEMFHSLGAPDLYHYNENGLVPVGGWDLMASDNAQHTTTWMKHKYGTWFNTVPEITANGTYKLPAVSANPFACYKIPVPESSDEFFMVEYRKKTGYDTNLYGSYDEGLLVYRVNTLNYGNAQGPPDEIYMLRPGVNENSENGLLGDATFSAVQNRTVLNSTTDPVPFLEDNTISSLSIYDVGVTGDSIEFKVGGFNITDSLAIDSLALVALYNATDGPNWTNNANWLTNPIANWYGITIENGRVTQINLGTNNLRGIIPSEIGTLTNLTDLNLSYNQLDDTIPSEIGNMINLQNLFLNNNQLNGIIPNTIGTLSQLQTLWLQYNELKGPIPSEIGNLMNLLFLRLYNNPIGGSMSLDILSLTNLKYLALSDNLLTGAIPPEIGALTNLENLYLHNNQLSGNIPSEIGSITGLQRLRVNSNQLNGILPFALCTLPLSDKIDLSNNIFDSQSCSTINCLKENGVQFYDTEQIQQDGFSLLNDCNIIEDCPQHFHPIWEGTSGTEHMNIYVIDAKYDGADLESGDEVGVFDGDLCVGYGKVEQTVDGANFLGIIVSKDDGADNGYTPGDGMIFKIWDCSAASEYAVQEVTYYDEYQNVRTPQLFNAGETAVVKLNGVSEVCFTVDFNLGWNIFSIPVLPDSTRMDTVFQPLIDNSSLVKIQNETGASMEYLAFLGGWNNTIGDIGLAEGYKVKVNASDTLQICGQPAEFPYGIPLALGWNIIGFPRLSSADAIVVLQTLIDKGTLIKVQDETGASIEYLIFAGGWVNNIFDFEPGEGYKVKVNAADTLWIYESYIKSSVVQPDLAETIHFQPEFVGNGVDHMNLNLVGLPMNIIKVGDELAVFDGETCVGAVTVMPHNLNSQFVSIAASAADGLGIKGFNEGNPFVLKLYSAKQNQEFTLEPEILQGSPTFVKHESTVASLEKFASTGLDDLVSSELSSIKCYPNPFTHEITIEISLNEFANISVEVFNQLGQIVKVINHKQIQHGGISKIMWNGKNENNREVSPGIYYLKIGINDIDYFKKVIYSK